MKEDAFMVKKLVENNLQSKNMHSSSLLSAHNLYTQGVYISH